MRESLQHIKFNNQQNPNATFDLIELETLFQRKDLDHSPFELHLVEFYMIMLIEDGQGKHTIDFTDYTYQKGTLLTIRKDQIQKFHYHPSVKGTLLLFTDNFLASYLEKLEALKSLQWLVKDNYATSIDQVVASVVNDKVVLDITIRRSRDKVIRRFYELWENTGAN